MYDLKTIPLLPPPPSLHHTVLTGRVNQTPEQLYSETTMDRIINVNLVQDHFQFLSRIDPQTRFGLMGSFSKFLAKKSSGQAQIFYACPNTHPSPGQMMNDESHRECSVSASPLVMELCSRQFLSKGNSLGR